MGVLKRQRSIYDPRSRRAPYDPGLGKHRKADEVASCSTSWAAAAGSGKSTLAERMRVRHGIPWFPLDALKMGLHLGAPSLDVHPDQTDLETADMMWPIIKGVLEHMLFDGRDYLVEGVNLRPRTIAAFLEQADEPIIACFLGYPDVSVETKMAHVARYAGIPNDWLNRTGEANVRRYLEVSRSLSRHLRDECDAYRLSLHRHRFRFSCRCRGCRSLS